MSDLAPLPLFAGEVETRSVEGEGRATAHPSPFPLHLLALHELDHLAVRSGNERDPHLDQRVLAQSVPFAALHGTSPRPRQPVHKTRRYPPPSRRNAATRPRSAPHSAGAASLGLNGRSLTEQFHEPAVSRVEKRRAVDPPRDRERKCARNPAPRYKTGSTRRNPPRGSPHGGNRVRFRGFSSGPPAVMPRSG